MAVLEAVRAGCRPLLPNRLSYPENFPDDFLYNDEIFVDRFMETLGRARLSPEDCRRLTEKFSWKSLAKNYTALLIDQC